MRLQMNVSTQISGNQEPLQSHLTIMIWQKESWQKEKVLVKVS